MSDGEEVTSNNATPRGPPHPGSYNAQQQQQPQQSQQQPQVTGSMGYQEEEEEDSQEQSESEESGEVEHATLAGSVGTRGKNIHVRCDTGFFLFFFFCLTHVELMIQLNSNTLPYRTN